MRLRDLRKLVEQFSGSGGGALSVDDPTEISVNENAGEPGAWLIALNSTFHPLGPIRIPGGRVSMVVPFFEVKNTGPSASDVVVFAIWAEGLGFMYGPSQLTTNDTYGINSTIDPVLGNFAAGPIWIPVVEDTNIYLLFAAGDSTGIAPPEAPVLVRNRHLGVLPV